MFTRSNDIKFVGEVPEDSFVCAFELSDHAIQRAKERFDDRTGETVGTLCTWALEEMSKNTDCIEALLCLKKGSEFGIRYAEHACFVMKIDEIKTVKLYGEEYTHIMFVMKTCFNEYQNPFFTKDFCFKKDVVFDVKTAKCIVIE